MSLPQPSSPILVLNYGLTFAELFALEGLHKIDGLFLELLRDRDAKAHAALLAWRTGDAKLTPLQVSELLLACGPVLEKFIAGLFGIEKELEELSRRTRSHDPIFEFKKFFVQRRARRRLAKKEEIEHFAEFGGETLPMQQVSHTQRAPCGLVFIGRADAAPGSADGVAALRLFTGLVQRGMVRQDQGGGLADKEMVAHSHVVLLQQLNLLHERDRTQHHAVADETLHVVMQDAGRDQM